MSSIVIAGDTSGTVTLAAPAVAGSTTLTLPATSGTVLTSTSATVGSSGITFSDGSTQTAAASPYVLKNRIINGAMVIDQRNAGASVSIQTSTGYTLDRWTAVTSQNSKYSVQQNAGSVTPPAGFTNYIGVTSSSAYAVTSGDYMFLAQYIEGYNVADLDFGKSTAKTITISFWVRSSLTGTFGGVIGNNDQNRTYPFTYTISVANTWEQKTITIAGDTTGTWNTTNSTGLAIRFGLGVGSTYLGTAGLWSSSQLFSATGATSVVGTSGATFYITGVQLEQNTSATPFERRLYNQELANCQRYYLKLNSGAQTTYTSFGVGVAYSTTGSSITVNYPVQMRGLPTYNYGGSLRLVGSAGITVTSSNLGNTSYLSSYVTAIVASGLTTGSAYWFGPNGDSTAFIDFSAEL